MKISLAVLTVALAAATAGAQGNPPPAKPLPPGSWPADARWQGAVQPDPFAACLFSPEEVMAHQSEISLKDDQRSKLAAEMGRAQSKATEVQWLIGGEQEKLQQLVRSAAVDETAVLKQMDRILSLEQDVKRAQMTLMVRVKNTLTAEQQNKLRTSRSMEFGWAAPMEDGRALPAGRRDSVPGRIYWTIPRDTTAGGMAAAYRAEYRHVASKNGSGC